MMKQLAIIALIMGLSFADYQMPISTFLDLSQSQIAALTTPKFGNTYYVPMGSNSKIITTYTIQTFTENDRMLSEPTTLTVKNKTLIYAMSYDDVLFCYTNYGANTCYGVFFNNTASSTFNNRTINPIRSSLTYAAAATRLETTRLQQKITADQNAVLTIPMATLRSWLSKER